MKNIAYCVTWTLKHRACKCNNSFKFSSFEFQAEVERDLVKLHFLNLNQLPKMIILEVTIKAN